MGAGLGGFLSATFGNAAELIIALLALRAGLTEVVKAILTGSILGNLLLVLGAAMFVGGWGRDKQTFNRTTVGAGGGHADPDRRARCSCRTSTPRPCRAIAPLQAPNIMQISVLVADRHARARTPPAWSSRSRRTATCSAAATRGGGAARADTRNALMLLVVATALTAIAAEIAGRLDRARREPPSAGPTCSSARSWWRSSATRPSTSRRCSSRAATRWTCGGHRASARPRRWRCWSRRSRCSASLLLGHPMPLVFDHFELGAILFAVLGVSFLCLDGESNWFEGMLLLAFYADHRDHLLLRADGDARRYPER